MGCACYPAWPAPQPALPSSAPIVLKFAERIPTRDSARPRSALLGLGLGVAALTLLGCASVAEQQAAERGPGRAEEPEASPSAQPSPATNNFKVSIDRLAEVQPADVFLLPTLDESGAFAAPLVGLRQAYYKGLVERLYTPIALEFGDRALEMASGTPLERALSASALSAQAVVQLRLLRWDTAELEAQGRILAELEAVWLAVGAGGGEALYAATLARPIELSGRQVRNSARADLEQRAAEVLIRDMLGRLPQRSATAAAQQADKQPSSPQQ